MAWGSPEPRRQNYVREVLASEARTASGTGGKVLIPEHQTAVLLTLDVTAAATDAGDTLDVTVQTLVDGTNWVDVAAFTQVVGNGGAKAFTAKIIGDAALAEFDHSASLSAGSKRDLIGDAWRAKWTVVDSGDGDQSFTFSVHALPM